MKHLFPALTLLAALAAGTSAHATPAELRDRIQAGKPAGCTEYSVLFWTLYRAELWTDAARPPGEAFGLSLTYRRKFSRKTLVESSVDEMVRMSGRPRSDFERAQAEMARAFRSVAPGDRITAWREPDNRVRLFHNGSETGVIRSDADLFMAIWLGPRTRDPKGRAKLLSGQCRG